MLRAGSARHCAGSHVGTCPRSHLVIAAYLAVLVCALTFAVAICVMAARGDRDDATRAETIT